MSHSLEAAGEHDRRSELAETSCERQCRAGREPAEGERQSDPAERTSRARAQRPRRIDEGLIDGFERRDCLANVERAGDEGDSENDRRLRERQLDAEDLQRRTEQPRTAERCEQPDSRDGWGQDERQLDQRDDECSASELSCRDEIGGWGAEEQDDRLGDQSRLDADDERVQDDLVAELVDESRERYSREDRDQRQEQERPRDCRGHE